MRAPPRSINGWWRATSSVQRDSEIEAMKEQYGQISARVDGHVALLEIDRPPNNFVSVDLMRDLADALFDVDADKSLRVSVLASAGKAFCAGADLASPTGVGGEGMKGINPLYVEAVRLFSAKKPIVAAIQGAAVGAGLGLALVADFRVVSPEARFTANFVKLGFHPLRHHPHPAAGRRHAEGAADVPHRAADQGRRGARVGVGGRDGF